jgi:hypothetical protein
MDFDCWIENTVYFNGKKYFFIYRNLMRFFILIAVYFLLCSRL